MQILTVSTSKSTFTLLFVFLSLSIFAQTKIIGIVNDKETKEPLIGVQIFADGTPSFAETNELGEFELTIPYKKDQLYQYCLLYTSPSPRD